MNSKITNLRCMIEGLSEDETDITKLKIAIREMLQTLKRRKVQRKRFKWIIIKSYRKLKKKIKGSEKLEKKILKYTKRLKPLMQEYKEKRDLKLLEERRHLKYLREMAAVRKSAKNVYSNELKAYKRKAGRRITVSALKAGNPLRRIRMKIKRIEKKHTKVKETITKLKNKLKILLQRRETIVLKDLKHDIKFIRKRIAFLMTEESERNKIVIYRKSHESRIVGFRSQEQGPENKSDVAYKVVPDGKSNVEKGETFKMKKVKKKDLPNISSISKTLFNDGDQKVKDGDQKKNLRKVKDVVEKEPLPIGDKLQDQTDIAKPKRLLSRFYHRKNRHKRRDSPYGDYKTTTTTTTTTSGDSEFERSAISKQKKKHRKPILRPTRAKTGGGGSSTEGEQKPKTIKKSLSFSTYERPMQPKSVTITDNGDKDIKVITAETTPLKAPTAVYDEKYFQRFAAHNFAAVQKKLAEERQKKLEFERQLAEEEQRRKMKENLPTPEKRTTSMESARLDNLVRKAMQSTFKMTDVIPQDVAIIDEDILKLAKKTNVKSVKDLLPLTSEQYDSTEDPNQENFNMPSLELIRKHEQFLSELRKSRKKPQSFIETIALSEASSSSPSALSLAEIFRSIDYGAESKTLEEQEQELDNIIDENDDNDKRENVKEKRETVKTRKSRKSSRALAKRVKGLAYSDESMYDKYLVDKRKMKGLLPEKVSGVEAPTDRKRPSGIKRRSTAKSLRRSTFQKPMSNVRNKSKELAQEVSNRVTTLQQEDINTKQKMVLEQMLHSPDISLETPATTTKLKKYSQRSLLNKTNKTRELSQETQKISHHPTTVQQEVILEIVNLQGNPKPSSVIASKADVNAHITVGDNLINQASIETIPVIGLVDEKIGDVGESLKDKKCPKFEEKEQRESEIIGIICSSCVVKVMQQGGKGCPFQTKTK